MTYTYEYPRPAVTVDAVVFRFENNLWEVLLIQRKFPPFENHWALPGGFLEMDETLEEAVLRELDEETGLIGIALEQLHSFSSILRDPRHRTITTAFWGILDFDCTLKASSDAKNLKWFSIKDLPPLAFDHKEIIELALTKV
ncbi:MAG: NUDIX hydrolase [Bacteroidota bacterium]